MILIAILLENLKFLKHLGYLQHNLVTMGGVDSLHSLEVSNLIKILSIMLPDAIAKLACH